VWGARNGREVKPAPPMVAKVAPSAPVGTGPAEATAVRDALTAAASRVLAARAPPGIRFLIEALDGVPGALAQAGWAPDRVRELGARAALHLHWTGERARRQRRLRAAALSAGRTSAQADAEVRAAAAAAEATAAELETQLLAWLAAVGVPDTYRTALASALAPQPGARGLATVQETRAANLARLGQLRPMRMPDMLAGFARDLGIARAAYQGSAAAFCAVTGVPRDVIAAARWDTQVDSLLPGYVLFVDGGNAPPPPEDAVCTGNDAHGTNSQGGGGGSAPPRPRTRLVLAVRGTQQLSDALLNACMAPAPLQVTLPAPAPEPNAAAPQSTGAWWRRAGLAAAAPLPEPTVPVVGAAHRGVLHAAEALAVHIAPALIALAAAHPGAPLHIVGHSLGGGTAAVLALLLHNRAPAPAGGDDTTAAEGTTPFAAATRIRDALLAGHVGAAGARLAPSVAVPVPVRAVCFATPSCVSAGLAAACRPWTTSVVHGDDLIPRFNLAAMEGLGVQLASTDLRAAALEALPLMLPPGELGRLQVGAGAAATLLARSTEHIRSTQEAWAAATAGLHAAQAAVLAALQRTGRSGASTDQPPLAPPAEASQSGLLSWLAAATAPAHVPASDAATRAFAGLAAAAARAWQGDGPAATASSDAAPGGSDVQRGGAAGSTGWDDRALEEGENDATNVTPSRTRNEAPAGVGNTTGEAISEAPASLPLPLAWALRALASVPVAGPQSPVPALLLQLRSAAERAGITISISGGSVPWRRGEH
jgi:hypothetical protein